MADFRGLPIREELKEFEPYDESPEQLALSPDGRLLATFGPDHTVVVWAP